MSWRPTDWTPLSEGDPIPGDPDQVRQLSQTLRNIAQTIEDQTQKLRTMCSDEYWDADAGKKFNQTAHDRANELNKAYNRYYTAAKSLSDYAPTLEDNQSTSIGLRQQAIALKEAHDSAQQRLSHDDAQPSDTPVRPGHQQDTNTVSDYWQELQKLQQQVANCAQAVHNAAKFAADQLGDVIGNDGLKDHWTDHVKQWIHDHADILKALANIAGWVATICGTLALVVGWIPIIGQALAAALTAVALLATAVSLVCHLALLYSGDGGILDVALDVVGLLTFGVGRAATAGIRGAVDGLKASSTMAHAVEGVLPRIVSKGGRISEDVVGALTHGSLSEASQLSGVSKSLLKGWMGNEVGGIKALTKTMAEGPGKFLPRGSDIVDAFKPSTYLSGLKDGWDGAKTLIHEAPSVMHNVESGMSSLAHNPGAALKDFAASTGKNFSMTPEVSASLKDAQHVAAGLNNQVVLDAKNVLHSQLTTNFTQMTGLAGTDWGNHFGVFNSAPDAHLNGVGQWEGRHGFDQAPY